MQWMDSVQNAADDGDDDNDDERDTRTESPSKESNRSNTSGKPTNTNSIFEEDLKYPHLKYSKAANFKDSLRENGDEWHQKSHERAKRAARPKEENKNTCSLYIQTDPLIWRHIREGIADVSSRKIIDLLASVVNISN